MADTGNSPTADEPQSKTCTRCHAAKPVTEFHKSKLGRFGVGSRCKPCIAVLDAERHKREQAEAPGRNAARQLVWRRAKLGKARRLDRERYQRDREKRIALVRAVQAANAERRKETQQAWRERNRPAVRASQRRAEAKARLQPKWRIAHAVRSSMNKRLKPGGKHGRRTFEALGYTPEQLMAHLERQFQPGMTWENHGRLGWHIDHKIPIAAFNFSSVDDHDFKRAWALENLQPLWAHENHRKSKTLDREFQPSLI